MTLGNFGLVCEVQPGALITLCKDVTADTSGTCFCGWMPSTSRRSQAVSCVTCTPCSTRQVNTEASAQSVAPCSSRRCAGKPSTTPASCDKPQSEENFPQGDWASVITGTRALCSHPVAGLHLVPGCRPCIRQGVIDTGWN
jgi:hypothetical protein